MGVIDEGRWQTNLTGRIRELCGDNPAAFARKAGIGDPLMRKYLKGSIPRADNVVRMAAAGRKSCDWLLTGQECRSVVEARDYGTPGARWAHDSIDMINGRPMRPSMFFCQESYRSKYSGIFLLDKDTLVV